VKSIKQAMIYLYQIQITKCRIPYLDVYFYARIALMHLFCALTAAEALRFNKSLTCACRKEGAH
jgi:hypothetical protein